MRIYKKLEDCMDDTIRIGDIVEACKRAEESHDELIERSFNSVCKGNDTLLSAYAWFRQQKRIYEHDIPNFITCIINEPLQTEEGKKSEE